MKTTLLKSFPAVFLAAFGMLAVPGESHASCDWNNRVFLQYAACLSGGHHNWCNARIFGRCIGHHTEFWAQAQAHCVRGNDKVVAKIDRKNEPDRTWHLTHSNRRTGDGNGKTNGVYCCKDLGRCN